VEDRSTADLMRELYDSLSAARVGNVQADAAQALRRSQLRLRGVLLTLHAVRRLLCMRATVASRIAVLLTVAGALHAPAAWSDQLVYGQPYGCNGDRFVVAYCRGDSDTGAYVTHPLDNRCNVTYIDRPRRNGFLPETGELRGDILKKIVACGDGAPGTAASAAPAAKATPQGNKTITVPGTGGNPVALARVASGTGATRVYYLDELSRKPTGDPTIVSIWMLTVFPGGDTQLKRPDTMARWVEYLINCANGSIELNVAVDLDRKANPLSAQSVNIREQPGKGTVGERVTGIACQTGAPLGGPRVTSTAAAMAAALKPATAATPAAATPAAGAPATKPSRPAKEEDLNARLEALNERWFAAYNRGDYDGAIAAMIDYIKLAPNHTEAYVFQSWAYLAKGDIDGVERALLQAKAVAPAHAGVYVELGSLYLKKRQDKERALGALRKVPQIPTATLQDLVVAGELLKEAGDEKSSTEAFRRAVQMSGDPRLLARGWVGFGSAQAKANRPREAIVALNEAVRLNPKSEDAHRALWNLYEDQGNAAAALSELEILVRLAPDDGWTLMFLGDAYAARKRTADAAAAYDKAFALASKDRLGRDLLSALSDSYLDIGRPDRAAEALRTSIAMPHDGSPEAIEDNMMRDMFECGKLGRALIAQKRYPDVVRLYLARGDCNGLGDSLGAGWLGIAYQRLGQPGKAIPLLEDATKGFEGSIAEKEAELASGKLTKDEREFAIEYLAEIRADGVQELDALGRAYLASGRKADAQRIARTLQKHDPKLGAQLAAEIARSA
jgi:tetratricopeptide (TPR) repeat protein